ncbi:MAG: DUF6515 family protein [Bacteroidales bacterium]
MKKTEQLRKRINQIIVVAIILCGLGIMNAQAQRTVVKTPRRTVVSTPTHTTVVRKPVAVVRTPRVVTAYPGGAVAVTYGGIGFRCYRGVYYKPVAAGYVIVPAPIGLRVKVLPPVYRTFVVAGRTYYYHHGAYYVRFLRGYKVVAAPTAFVVTALPATHTTVVVNGVTYYSFDGAKYEKIVLESGEVQYCKVIL